MLPIGPTPVSGNLTASAQSHRFVERLQGSSFEAEILVRGMNASFTAPLHLERLTKAASRDYAAIPAGDTIAARLWARIYMHTRCNTLSRRTETTGGAQAVNRPLDQYVRCAQHI
jgi:hypothetical protein